jgi:integrase
MASVRKRILRSGEIRWQVDYRDREGKRRHKQFGTKANAVAFETKVRTELAAGTHVADSASVTVQVAGDLWLERGQREGLEAGTLNQYRQHLKHHIVPLIGQVKLSKLTTPDVERFRDNLLADRSRPLARAVLTSFKGIIKEAKRRGLIAHDPAADTSVSLSKRGKAKVTIPTKDEIRTLLATATELWPYSKAIRTRKGEQKIVAISLRPLVVTAIFTGLRASELRGLMWDHVNFDEGVIQVRQRADFQNVIGHPKSEAGTRDVPMAPMVANTLKSWKLACPSTPMNLVFPTENGTIHTNSNIHRHCWGPLQRKAGLTDVVGQNETGLEIREPRYAFHALRHAAASLFIEQGWSPKKVQTVMGHASIQVTFDTYGHLWKTPDDDQKAMAQIEARLLAQPRQMR